MRCPAIVPNYFSFIFLNLALRFSLTISYSLDMTGYEHCIFNLVEYASKTSLVSPNLTTTLLANSFGIHRLTIFLLDLTDLSAFGVKYQEVVLNDARYLKEFCSVDVIIAVDSCSQYYPLNLQLQVRMLLRENILLLIQFEKLPCADDWEILSVQVAYAYSLYMSADLQPSSAYSFCFDCAVQDLKLQVPQGLNLSSPKELQKFTSQVYENSKDGTILAVTQYALSPVTTEHAKLFQFLYKTSNELIPEVIGCYTDHIFIANAANLLNVTAIFRHPHEVLKFNYLLSHSAKDFSISAVAITGIWELNEFLAQGASDYQTIPLVVDEEMRYFLYCVKGEEREAFSAKFWIIPLDFWTWTLLGISCGLLTIQLNGDWFQIYSILMRQSCTILEKNRMLLIFILATIIFTYGYEGIISSFLTVPPPVKVFETLSQLIENGYKITGYHEEGNYSELNELFRNENISSSVKSKILKNNTYFTNSQYMDSTAACNTTSLYLRRREESFRYYIEDVYPGIKCHTLTRSRTILQKTYLFFGHMQRRLSRIGRFLTEAGVLLMVENFETFIATLASSDLIRGKIKEEEAKSREVPFGIDDWKILSIIVGWGALIGISSFVLVLELKLSKILIQLNHIDVISILDCSPDV